ncbi:MAG TPA: hypothetical protein VFG81_03195 [Anaerolineales bacterium]|nr:hypothetical protein [Anaerolineales bacterium]
MNQSRFLFKPALYIAIGVYIALAYSILAMGDSLIAATIPEDHYFELVGACSFLVTSILFFYGFHLARKRLDNHWDSLVKKFVYLGLALVFLFGAGEEISWGQRILGFKTPEPLSQVNRQEEFNLHNLTAWEASDFLDPDRLFDIFWFLFAVLLPAIALVVPTFRKFAGRFVPIVFWGIGLLFLYNYLCAKLVKILFDAAYVFKSISFPQAIQEIKESNYALIFILVGLYAVWDLKQLSVRRTHLTQPSMESL